RLRGQFCTPINTQLGCFPTYHGPSKMDADACAKEAAERTGLEIIEMPVNSRLEFGGKAAIFIVPELFDEAAPGETRCWRAL
ncbi:MAG TPA: hypothetical protein VLZ74_15510, partial [Methylocella sp.]|nr:hypothetical protein [Methylocella sp.]